MWFFCNLAKGSNLAGIDAATGAIVPLFHPRRDSWPAHFAVQDVLIVGLTPMGRATVRVLNMNAVDRTELRRTVRGRQ